MESSNIPLEANHDSASKIQKTGDLVDNFSKANNSISNDISSSNARSTATRGKRVLSAEEYKRYGRVMIMPEIGLRGQLQLKQSRVLLVGVGGLGCPAAAYLAGAGVGTLGLMDGDVVEVSNLHRQIAHSADRVGMNKAESAGVYLKALNPLVTYRIHPTHLTPETAISIFSQYDLILDCTDHPTSRYLISDACVLTGRPLVSASALRTEGQLIVLNHPPLAPGDPLGGPCYRCIFPRPPPAASLLSCGEGGILGPVVGTMGVLQALEAIKVLTVPPLHTAADASSSAEPPKPTLLMFSAYSMPQFRSVRMRARRVACAACSAEATISAQSLTSGSLDYVAFCGVTDPVKVLAPEQRISAADFAKVPPEQDATVIDVRDETQFALCSLEGSINVPWTGNAELWLERARERGLWKPETTPSSEAKECYILCRFGNDSQLAAQAILDSGNSSIKVKDIKGGLKAWREEVDPEWPDY